ncbi:transcriptional regulator domain-containing protein [Magnetovibrio sp.]|uniref:transcriptional regulator domain-containing protein n=1 Tax=Magnetovibrio sp. TaxID=2024836 RepID=UPI002F957D58
MVFQNIHFVQPLPNWKLGVEYENIRGLRSRELAWQFLRRNPAYRSDYEAWKTVYEEAPLQAKEIEINLCEKYGIATRPGDLRPNLGLANPHFFVPSPFFTVEDKRVTPVVLTRWPSPDRPQKYNRVPEVPEEPCIDIRMYAHSPFSYQQKQLKKIFDSFVNLAEESRRQIDDTYIEYLRILDGVHIGATIKEIANHLGQKTDFKDNLYNRYSKKKKRAVQIMECDYVKIANNYTRR